MRLLKILPYAIGLAVIVSVGAYVVMGEQAKQEQKGRRQRAFTDQPAPVLVARATTADVPVYFDAVGTTRALNTVTIRAQVGGKLMKIAFREGQDVKAGDVIAEIDPRTYQALLDQAIAKKAQDEATLANARIDLDRYTRLAAANSGSKQQADTQKSVVAQLEAQVALDQAAIDNARAMLSYTRITAPFAGRTGLRLIDEGNLVQPGDSTGIVVITQIRPIAVLFNLPQQQFPQISKALAAGPVPVDAISGDGRTVLDRGTLQVIDNQMDQSTGTIRMKAEFPNASLQLWPGQFVNIRALVQTLNQVVTVPTAAVQRGPNGTFAFVVQPDATVAVRPVTVTQQDDQRAVIATGLQADDQVVTTGFTRLAAGTRVNIQVSGAEPAATTPDATPTDPPRERRRKRGEGSDDPDRKDGRRKRTEGSDDPDRKERRRTETAPDTKK